MVKLKKIKASTLIESIVAMVIISISMYMTFFVISNVSVKNNPQLKFKAYTEALNIINSAKTDYDLQDKTWQKEGLHIETQVIPYNDYENLRIFKVTIYNNNNRVLVERKELLNIP